MKATEQYFPVVLFIMLYKVVLIFRRVDEILWCDHSNESYWSVLSCGTVYYMYKVVLSFRRVDEILWCDHSNESYWAVLSCSVYCAVQDGPNFWVCGWDPMVWPFKWKLLSSTFLWVLFIKMYKVVQTLEFVDKTLWCDHSINTSLTELLHFISCYCTKPNSTF